MHAIVLLFIGFALSGTYRPAHANTMPTLLQSYAGNISFIGTQRSLRTQSNSGNACALVSGSTTAGGSTATTATLSGLPSGATITAAYLYWAGSGSTPDYNITFEGSSYTANRQYTSTYTTYTFFSGVADVTAAVAAKGNGTYSFSGLTVNAGSTYCDVEAVLGGWALLVIYSHPSEEFRVLNLYEGFQYFLNNSITLNLSNFVIPSSFTGGKHAHITWEGDPTLSGGGENLTFNGISFSDANNPLGNQFNSVSNATSPADTTSYGVDFDIYSLTAPAIQAGQTSGVTVYSTGPDLVLLSAEIISVPNIPATDLAISMSRDSILIPGQSASYTIDVSNNGPLTETGPITVTVSLPTGLSYSSAAGAGWSCGASGQTVTCTRTGSLAVGASSASLVLTVAVAANAQGAKAVTAAVGGALFDNQSSNNSATDSYTIPVANLSLAKSRGAALSPGANAVYTLTVTNNGSGAEPGPVTVIDTLPAMLTYVSASGAGWSCGASGQVVSCTRNGSLANGASAPAITLTAAVSSSATGTVTNTATVTGSGYDNNLANNTASDTYTFPVAYAYYAMDETGWNGTAGEVKDSSGNNRHASRMMTSTTTTTNQSTTFGHDCRGAVITANTLAGVYAGVQTAIDINSLGNSGTIAFWYYNNAAWNTSGNANDRTLLDATGTNQGEFWLVLRQNGALQFSLDNASGSLQTANGTSRTSSAFSANNWHHIAISWNFTAGSRAMYIYVDGVLDGSRVNNNVTSTNNYGTLAIGDSMIGPFTNPNRGNSANGIIDEVRIYDTDLSAADIAAVMNYSHTCISSPHHYELSLPTSGLTCLPSTVTVTACADSSSPCTNLYTAADGATASLSVNGGTLGASTVTFNASGVASTTLSYPAAADNTTVTVTLSGESIAATSSRQCCPNGTSCSVANSCNTTFNTAGFIVSAAAGGGQAVVPTQIAGTSSGTYYLRAVRSSGSSPPDAACEAALTGPQTVNVGYECNNPATCHGSNLMTVNGGGNTTVARNNNGSNASKTPVTMTFDTNGNAPFSFLFNDVGRATLWFDKTVNSALLSGSTNPFVVRPAGFVLTNIQQTSAPNLPNPAAADATGGRFVKAGEAFSATVSAVTSSGDITPSFGRESSPEGVTLTTNLVSPSGGNNPGLDNSGNTIAGSGFSGTGSATATNLRWGEAGIITLRADLTSGSYLASGFNVMGTSGNVGRFYPAHFDTFVTHAIPTPTVCPTCGFTYSRQAFVTDIFARNLAGDTVRNYDNGLGYSKAVTLTAWDGSTGTVANAAVGTLTNSALAATAFTMGTARTGTTEPLVRPLIFGFANARTEPTWIRIRAQEAAGGDGVTSLRTPFASSVEGQTEIRSGRFNIQNVHGSELLPAPVVVTVQQFINGGFSTNTLDGTTSVQIASSSTPGASELAFDNFRTFNSIDVAGSPIGLTMSGGQGVFTLARPASTGSVTMQIPSQADANCTLNVPTPIRCYLSSGLGIATFGLFKSSNRVIYIRERY